MNLFPPSLVYSIEFSTGEFAFFISFTLPTQFLSFTIRRYAIIAVPRLTIRYLGIPTRWRCSSPLLISRINWPGLAPLARSSQILRGCSEWTGPEHIHTYNVSVYNRMSRKTYPSLAKINKINRKKQKERTLYLFTHTHTHTHTHTLYFTSYE